MRSLVKRHCVFLITKSSLSVLMRSLFYEENFLVKRYPGYRFTNAFMRSLRRNTH